MVSQSDGHSACLLNQFMIFFQEFSMFEWLKCLPIHTFSPRHFESEDNPRSPLNAAAKRAYHPGTFQTLFHFNQVELNYYKVKKYERISLI